jgi:diguanylate cyclase (GGDEF)-like protein
MAKGDRRDESWRGGLRLAAIGVVVAVVASLAINYLLLFSDTLTPFGRGVALSILLPVLIGGPAFFAIGRLRWQAREMRRRLQRTATYDELTQVLNGKAFAGIVERRRESPFGSDRGAFLVIDAAEVRAINRRHGVDWGEEALRLIAAAIRGSVRAGDVVGRTSQNEFGVYLSGAREEDAQEVGERIRAAVAEVYFAPGGTRDMLGVSVAGVVFESELEFTEMLREAARQLPARGVARKVALAHFPPSPLDELGAN